MKKFVVFLVIGAVVLAAIPLAVVGGLGILSASTLNFHHANPGQSDRAFASAVMPFTNPSFSEPLAPRFNTSVAGWEQTIPSGSAIAGALNVREFHNFRQDTSLFPGTAPSFMTQNPGDQGTGNNILVMANRASHGRSMTAMRSSEFTLYADGYFIISFNFFAVASANAAYLVNQDGETVASMRVEPVSMTGLPETYGMWQTASFFIRTDARQPQTLTLNLHLGTHIQPTGGVVYYSNVRVEETTHHLFNQRYNTNLQTHERVDLTDHEEFGVATNIELTDFTRNAPNVGGTQMRMIMSSQAHQRGILNFEDHEYLHSFNSDISRNVMLVSSINGTASMRLDTPVTIDRHVTYKLSFYALSRGSAHMRVFDPLAEQRNRPSYINPFDSGYLSIGQATHAGIHARNNWVLNTLFIRGAALADTPIYIEFKTGYDDAPGWVMIDELSFVRVSHEYYVNAQEIPNVQSVTARRATGEGLIQNADFNVGNIRDVTNPFPLVADSWEIGGTPNNDSRVLNGIVNTQPTHWNNHAPFGHAVNPGQIPALPGGLPRDANNNVFMLQNTSATRQTLTSTPFLLSPGMWNVVDFNVARQVQHRANITAALVMDGVTLVELDLGTTSNVGWQNQSIALRISEFASGEVTLVFTLESTLGFATMFIDGINFDQSAARPSRVGAWRDFTNALDGIFFESDVINIDASGDAISLNTLATYQTATVMNTHTQTLDGPAFFRYTVTAALDFRGWRPAPKEWDPETGDEIEEPDDVEHGVNIKLNDMDGGFENLTDIRSLPSYRQGGWVDFVFYIRTSSEGDLNLLVEFGNEWRRVNASLLVRGMELERIDEVDFNNARTDIARLYREGLADNRVIATPAGTAPGGDDGDGDTTPGGGADLDWLIVPSMILAATILFAIGAFLYRKFKFNRHIEKRHTSYAKDDAGVRGASRIEDLVATSTEQPKGFTDADL